MQERKKYFRFYSDVLMFYLSFRCLERDVDALMGSELFIRGPKVQEEWFVVKANLLTS